MVDVLRVGQMLYRFCGGAFDGDSYEDKRVEAIGADWVGARGVDSGSIVMFVGDPEELLPYTIRDDE